MKLTKKVIGTKEFAGIIDITDPCYNKDVWCRMNATVKAGSYECVVWKQTEKYEYEGKEHKYQIIGIIGIYLGGIIPVQNQMEEIGYIGVDAGLAGFFMNKPDYTDEQWTEFCDSIRKGDAWIKPEGFFSSSGLGDGGYPVYAYKDKDDNITALEIRFC